MEAISNTPLAVVGMACRLPGAEGLDQFWQLLKDGRNAVREIPSERFNRKLYYDPKRGVRGKSYTSIACLIDYRPPDTSQCPLTEDQIRTSDVAHVTMCEVASEACIHAGLDPFEMPVCRTGVYVGHTHGSAVGGDFIFAHLVEHTAEYLREVNSLRELTESELGAVIEEVIQSVRSRYPQRERDNNPDPRGFHAAGLISEALRLDGPFMTVNAACASSLQALAIAARAVQLGEIDMAIVGGAAYCKRDSLILFSHAQSASATGSRPFSADADGLVIGEGYVAFIIKALDRALRENTQIHAVIRGIGMSCDGKGKSLWAPRKEGQVEAMRRAYCHGLDMSRVQYVEAHATSTTLGDATELAALDEVLRESLPEGTRIPIGSVKANIGHTVEAAGLAGLLKTILSMQHGTVPPVINTDKLNPNIDWGSMPFYVPRTAVEWPTRDGHPRRAGVNSFGIGGLNVHVVVDDSSPAQTTFVGVPEDLSLPDDGSTYRPAGESIAIIGMGGVLPGARNVDTYWELLRSGRDPKSPAPRDRWNNAIASALGPRPPFGKPSILGGFITDFHYDWKTHRIPPKQITSADPLQFMMLEAVEEALQASGYTDPERFDPERTAVYVGAITGGEFHEHLQMGLRLPEFQEELARILAQKEVRPETIRKACGQFGEILLERMPALADETGSYTTSTLATRITKTFNLMGGAAAIDAGMASAAAALNTAVNALRAGDCDMVICVAGEKAMGPTAHQFCSLLGFLACEPPLSPFDSGANGFVLGEGAGAVILKRLSDARSAGDKMFAVIRSIGSGRSDTHQNAMQLAIARSLRAAHLEPDAVSFVETATRGLPTVDAQEILALASCYGRTPRPRPLLLGALASQIGLLDGGSAMAGLIKVVLALRHRELPGNFGLSHPAGFLNAQTALDAPRGTLPLEIDNNRRLVAGLNASCLYQLAYHFLLETGDHGNVAPRDKKGTLGEQRWRIVRLQGDGVPDLIDKLKHLGSEAEESFQIPEACFGPNGRIRLAIVAESPQQLSEKSELAAHQLMQPKGRDLLEEKGIFCREVSSERPRIAFLFPGQGSEYPGMLQSLIQDFPPAAKAAMHIDSVLARLGYPTVADVLGEKTPDSRKEIWRTQLSVLIADTILYASLTALRILPERIAGHGFGEFPALIAAGAWSFEDAARASWARCTAIVENKDVHGLMVSVKGPREVVEERLREANGKVVAACYNAPDEIVIAGGHAAVLEFAERLRRDGFFTFVIDAPALCYTPAMRAFKAPLAKALAQIAIDPPVVPVLSGVDNRYVADPDEIRAHLVAQLARPVLYFDLVKRLVKEGITVFVEVGPRQILTRLNRRIVPGRQRVVIGTDQPKRNGLQQLTHVTACLEAAGALEVSPRDPLGSAL